MKKIKFPQKQLEKIALEFEKEQFEKEEKMKVYFQSVRFKDIISKIKNQLKTNKTLSDNAYTSFLFDDVTNDEFIYVFEILFNQNIYKTKVFEDLKNPFYNQYIVFENLKFSEISGQGTAFFVEFYN